MTSHSDLSLVGGWPTPLKNDGVRQLGLLFPIYGKSYKIHVPNHQPDHMWWINQISGISNPQNIHWWSKNISDITQNQIPKFHTKFPLMSESPPMFLGKSPIFRCLNPPFRIISPCGFLFFPHHVAASPHHIAGRYVDLAVVATFDEGHLQGLISGILFSKNAQNCSSNHHFSWLKIPVFGLSHTTIVSPFRSGLNRRGNPRKRPCRSRHSEIQVVVLVRHMLDSSYVFSVWSRPQSELESCSDSCSVFSASNSLQHLTLRNSPAKHCRVRSAVLGAAVLDLAGVV